MWWLLYLCVGTASALVDFTPYCDYGAKTCTMWPEAPYMGRPSAFRPELGAPMDAGWTLYVVPCHVTCTPPNCKFSDFTGCGSHPSTTYIWTQEELGIANTTLRSAVDSTNVVVHSSYTNLTGIYPGTGVCAALVVTAPQVIVRGLSIDVATDCGAAIVMRTNLTVDYSGIVASADMITVYDVGVTGAAVLYATETVANIAIDTVRITAMSQYSSLPARQAAAVACFYQASTGGSVNITNALHSSVNNVAFVTGYGGAQVTTDSTVTLVNVSRVAYMTPKEYTRVVKKTSTSKAHAYMVVAIMAIILVILLIAIGFCIHKSMAHHEKIVEDFDKFHED